MKKIYITIVAAFATACMPQNKPAVKNYADAWAHIEMLRRQDLPQSVLPEVEQLYRQAQAEKNCGQLLKALIFRINCIGVTEENEAGANAIFRTLKDAAPQLPTTAKAVVYSMIAQLYEDYHRQNAWSVGHRTRVATGQADDVHTLNARRLTEEAVRYYRLSLLDREALQREPAERFADILQGDCDAGCLPSLYDLLAKRALAYFSSDVHRRATPQQAFVVNNPDYFADAPEFAALHIRPADSSATGFLSLNIYQELLRFHLNRPDTAALIDVDLRRLSFLRDNGRFAAGNDRLYEQALIRLSRNARTSPHNVRVMLRLVRFYLLRGDAWRDHPSEENRAGYADAMRICTQMPATDGRVKELLEEIGKKEWELGMEETLLPGKPSPALLKYRNIEALYQWTYKLSEQEATAYRTAAEQERSVEDFVASLQKTPAVKRIELPAQTDFQYYATEIRIDPLEKGCYLLLFADTAAHPFAPPAGQPPAGQQAGRWRAMFVQASSLMAYDRTVNGLTTFRVTHRDTGAPLPDVEISVTGEKFLLTDRNGTAQRREEQMMRSYSATCGDDRLLVFRTAYNRRQYGEKDADDAIVLTDRAVYRPGQAVCFKAILFRRKAGGERTLLCGRRVKMRFRDVNRRLIAEQTLTSGDFGGVDGCFTVPEGLLNGYMTVECDGIASVGVRVEEYKRPAFEVRLDPVEGNVAPNGKARVTAQARTLSGYAVNRADVRYRVERIAGFRYGRMEESREIAAGVGKTDGTGAFAVAFDALVDDADDDRRYAFVVTTDVTDANGETRSASLTVYVGKTPLLVSANLPDEIFANMTDDCLVETTNLNGDFTPASVTVEIIALRRPEGILRRRLWRDERIDVYAISEDDFRRDFPLDEYAGELRPERFEAVDTVASYALDTERDRRLDLTAMKRAGDYKIRLTAKSRTGIAAENVYYVSSCDSVPRRIGDMDQWLRQVKTTAEPGECAELWIAGGVDSGFVYCELILHDKVAEARWIAVGAAAERVTFPVGEIHRGGFVVQLCMIRNNRQYAASVHVAVPYTNRALTVEVETFRSPLLPGARESRRLKVSDSEGRGVEAEVAVSLSDAALEAFAPHRWPDLSAVYFRHADWYSFQWNDAAIGQYAPTRRPPAAASPPTVRTPPPACAADINWFDRTYLQAFHARPGTGGLPLLRSAARSAAALSSDFPASAAFAENDHAAFSAGVEEMAAPPSAVQIRENFAETAFFYPALRTDEQGETLVDFTMPDALTRWTWVAFACTKDFKIGAYTGELVTRKLLAVSANPPRFFRENDRLTFTAKVYNLTDSAISGRALLRLFDAVAMQPVTVSDTALPFRVNAGESAALGWQLAIPEGLQAITCRVTAQAAGHVDGEEATIPVLPDAVPVTETMPFCVRAGEERSLTFDRLANHRSTTLRTQRLTLEYAASPAWYAVQALPYLMEYPQACAEQTFARFYANALASTAGRRSPRIRRVFDNWQKLGGDALASNLEKNTALKQLLLEETPWVAQAVDESERKRRLGLLFDLNRMGNEMTRSLDLLTQLQNEDGGFPWFAGQPSNRFITQHILAGMAHIERLDALPLPHAITVDSIRQRGMRFIARELRADSARLTGRGEQTLTLMLLHALYACSFNGLPLEEVSYLELAARSWKNLPSYGKAMAALVLHRNNRTAEAQAIVRSLKEYAMLSPDIGMYWKDNVAGDRWFLSPVETQAMLIEAFDEVAADREAVEEMKIWLLRHKQTNGWRTTKATTEAVYALLMTGGDLLSESASPEIALAGRPLADVAPESGTGYASATWYGGDNLAAAAAGMTVKNPNRLGIVWGGLYWQYVERLDKITSPAERHLKIKKALFLRTLTSAGEVLQPVGERTRLQVGDLVRVRMELRADRDYEFVHLKDLRAAGLEPVNVRSGNRCQDGLLYYESVKDASVNFFIHALPKGVYVFEYDLRASHAGDFSNGITTFQCMYAPEFATHSEGLRLSIARP